MKIAIIGAGAIGSLLGALLKREGFDCILIGRKNHVDAIRKNGLSITGSDEFNINIDAFCNPLHAKDSDIFIITTKAYDTRNAIHEIIPFIGDNVTVMSLQNGAGNIEEISKLVNKKQILGAITSMGAFVEAPGRIQFRGKGTTIIGSAFDNKKKAMEIIDIFNKAQIKTQFSDDIYRDIWSKVIINSGINTIASILDNENGVLLDKNLMEIVREVTNEGKNILQKEGVEIPEDIFDTTVEIIRNTSKNINSMLSDLRKGKRTEIDFISGKVVALGDKLGIPAPYNKTLLNMIKYKENEC